MKDGDVKLGKRTDSKINFVATLMTYVDVYSGKGGLRRDEVDRSDPRHVKFTVEGEEHILLMAEEHFYSKDNAEQFSVPITFARSLLENLQDVKALLHS